MSWTLKVISNGTEVASHRLDPDATLTLGRGTSRDIVINDRSVSREHCKVSVTPKGVLLEDMGAANGLTVHGQRLPRVVLGDGDACQLGMVTVVARKTASNHTGMIPLVGLMESLSGDESSSGAGQEGFPSLSSSSGAGSRSGPPSLAGLDATAISTTRSEFATLEKERLATLVATGKSLGQSTNLDELLSRIMDHLFEILPVRRAVIALVGEDGKVEAKAVRPEADTAELSSVASLSIIQQVVESGEGSIIQDAALDQKLRGSQSIVISNIRAAICVPIVVNNRSLGAVYCDYPGRARLYTESDLDFLTAFASIAGVSVQNARMMQRLRNDEKLQRDLEIAAEIQQGLLPNTAFSFPGLEIDWAYWPSLHVGGDFYDVTELPDGRIAFTLGDVSGKSIPAALYMARTLSFLRATVTRESSPGEVLQRTNRLLDRPSERVIFATTFLMFVDPKTGVVEWCNAGHNPALVRRPGADDPLMLEALAPPLGMFPDQEFPTHHLQLDPDSIVTLYTDGLPEARDVEGRPFSLGRVSEIVDEHADRPIAEGTRALLTALETHIVDSPYLRDDVAILNIRYVSTDGSGLE